MDGTEDFTFPRINDPHPFTIDSPPLWNPSLSSSSSTEDTRKASEGFEAKVMCDGQRESFPNEDDDQDRMDLLWENFNEDLSSTSASATSFSSTEIVDVSCASAALTVVKSNGSVVASDNCKPDLLVLLKFLKKLFSLSNSQSKPTTTQKTASKVC